MISFYNSWSYISGWMQLVIIISQVTGASQAVPIYMMVKVMISSFVFIHAFDLFESQWMSEEFSAHHFFKVSYCTWLLKEKAGTCMYKSNIPDSISIQFLVLEHLLGNEQEISGLFPCSSPFLLVHYPIHDHVHSTKGKQCNSNNSLAHHTFLLPDYQQVHRELSRVLPFICCQSCYYDECHLDPVHVWGKISFSWSIRISEGVFFTLGSLSLKGFSCNFLGSFCSSIKMVASINGGLGGAWIDLGTHSHLKLPQIQYTCPFLLVWSLGLFLAFWCPSGLDSRLLKTLIGSPLLHWLFVCQWWAY